MVPPLKRRGKPAARRWAVGCGGLAVLVAAGLAALAVAKPWAPEIQVVEPGGSGRRVTDDGLLGNYYPAPDAASGRVGAVLLLGGSEGGLSVPLDAQTHALQRSGLSALALSYWGGPGQPSRMEELPLELFGAAIDWLKRQPEVDPARVAVLGGSKGAEAALLVATRRSDLSAVVATMPSSVVWSGIDLVEIWRMVSIGSTWSEAGRPVPHLPYPTPTWGETRAEGYARGLQSLPEHPEAAIPVERITAPVLLVCGEDDTLWPSCPMARQLQERARQRSGPPVTLLSYPAAGHLAQGTPLPAGHPFTEHLGDLGGTIEGNRAAMADAWPQILTFLGGQAGS